MAVTSYGVNHPLAVKLWAKRLFREALKATYANRFMGESSNSLLQIKTDTAKGPGDRITTGLRFQLSGTGVLGDGTLEGSEEPLTIYTDNVLIDQLRHAVRTGGRMSQQRVPFSIREEARVGLTDWLAGRIDEAFFNHICGYTPQTDLRFTAANTTTAPDASHRIWFETQTTVVTTGEESVSTTAVFTLPMIDRAVEVAKTVSPLIRPVQTEMGEYYVMFLHPFQVTDLRAATAAAGSWTDIQKAAMQGGMVERNPIFTGALGVYNGVVLHESTRVPFGINSVTGAARSVTRRAVLCGAQAATIAFGMDNTDGMATWVEEFFDYGNQLGVSAGLIYGLKKNVFNSADFATVQLTTYAAAHNA